MNERRDFEAHMVTLLPRLRRFAIGLAGSAEEGEDLLQAACLKALEKWQQWRPGTRLDSWVYKIIHTTWLDRRKSATRRLVDFDTDAAVRASDRVASTTIEQEIEMRGDLQRAQRAIDSLPPDQRAVLMLVVGQGLTYQEASAALQIPMGTVMSRLARARWALGRMTRNDGDKQDDDEK
ncbi:MAG TPA: RNA polymerase sigma factor [Dongiaceae bacterium]|nr:RNA polymerase sigma factor [Dongiaceae bacterium]